MNRPIAVIAVTLCLPVASLFGQLQFEGIPLLKLENITNRVFFTLEDFSIGELDRLRLGLVSSNRLAEAMASEESRPEDKDPPGHWGTVSQGFRISLRFAWAELTNGQPVVATVLIRNVSDHDLNFWRLGTARDFEFEILDAQDKEIPEANPPAPGFLGEKKYVIPPGMQRRCFLRLDGRFKLDVGEYSVRAKTHVDKLEGHGFVDATSGTARIKIVPPGSPPGSH